MMLSINLVPFGKSPENEVGCLRLLLSIIAIVSVGFCIFASATYSFITLKLKLRGHFSITISTHSAATKHCG